MLERGAVMRAPVALFVLGVGQMAFAAAAFGALVTTGPGPAFFGFAALATTLTATSLARRTWIGRTTRNTGDPS